MLYGTERTLAICGLHGDADAICVNQPCRSRRAVPHLLDGARFWMVAIRMPDAIGRCRIMTALISYRGFPLASGVEFLERRAGQELKRMPAIESRMARASETFSTNRADMLALSDGRTEFVPLSGEQAEFHFVIHAGGKNALHRIGGLHLPFRPTAVHTTRPKGNK